MRRVLALLMLAGCAGGTTNTTKWPRESLGQSVPEAKPSELLPKDAAIVMRLNLPELRKSWLWPQLENDWLRLAGAGTLKDASSCFGPALAAGDVWVSLTAHDPEPKSVLVARGIDREQLRSCLLGDEAFFDVGTYLTNGVTTVEWKGNTLVRIVVTNGPRELSTMRRKPSLDSSATFKAVHKRSSHNSALQILMLKPSPDFMQAVSRMPVDIGVRHLAISASAEPRSAINLAIGLRDHEEAQTLMKLSHLAKDKVSAGLLGSHFRNSPELLGVLELMKNTSVTADDRWLGLGLTLRQREASILINALKASSL